MASRRLLVRILRSLVDEWGKECVQSALSSLVQEEGADYSRTRKKSNPGSGAINNFKLEISRLSSDKEHEDLLLKIYDDFKAKKLLPSVGAVRSFLEMHGVDPVSGDRSSLTLLFIRAAAGMPRDDLDVWRLNNLSVGISNLSDLSDAVKEFSSSSEFFDGPKNDSG
jgi:hypothetical protein